MDGSAREDDNRLNTMNVEGDDTERRRIQETRNLDATSFILFFFSFLFSFFFLTLRQYNRLHTLCDGIKKKIGLYRASSLAREAVAHPS